MKTPITFWPRKIYRGKPGYSAAHFAALDGAPEDPLSVAERIQNTFDSEAIQAQVAARLAEGERPSSIAMWQSREQQTRSANSWEALCQSFDLVIETLERAPNAHLPGWKRLIREAKRARKASQ